MLASTPIFIAEVKTVILRWWTHIWHFSKDKIKRKNKK
jgi:hypothetical protein